MGLFGKKKEVKELRLPESPLTFPELPKEMPEDEEMDMMSSKPNLPNLPLLKASDSLPGVPSLPELPTIEFPRKNSLSPQSPPRLSIPKRIAELTEKKVEMGRKEPVFVKIDRFKDAMSSFETIKKKLNETSSLLEKIKEGRKEEEEELNRWTEELESIKNKISVIDKKIFSSLE